MHGSEPIPFFRYSTSCYPLEEELFAAVADVMRRGAFILQEDLRRFEADLGRLIEATVLGVANGTDALMLALRALGIGPGDEVVLPSHTYVASAAAVRFVGATPVLVEVGDDHLLDPSAVEAALSPATRAIMPVQLNGRVCDMEALAKIAEAHDLLVVEDAAQALGARFREQPAGSFGSAAAFSFYPAKVLGCLGDGGAVASVDPEVVERVALLRDHGRDASGTIVAWGLNSRLDNLQAAILEVRLRHLSDDIARRRAIASRYREQLCDVEELVLPPGPDEEGQRFDVYQNYEIEAPRRDDLVAHLAGDGISAVVQWGGRAVHQFPELGFKVRLPRTERIFERCLLLPMNTTLRDDEVGRVAASVRRFFAGRP